MRKFCHTWPAKGSRLEFKGKPLMSISGRRFELLLPLKFNDTTAVPEHLITNALVELRHKFGAVSSETQPWEG